MDYRQSHITEGKGQAYDLFFRSASFSTTLWRLEKDFLDIIISRNFISVQPDHLDFACGTGRLLSYFSDKTKLSVGIDVSNEMLKIARFRCPSSRLIEGDLTMEPILGEQQFDLITAFRFFPNAQDALKEEVMLALEKALKPGGLLIFNNHKNIESLLYRLAHLIKRGSFSKGVYNHKLKDHAERSGLSLQAIYGIGVLPVPDTANVFFPGLFYRLEKLAAHLISGKLAQNIIFVYKKDG